MNTNLTARSTIRFAALTACLALLFAGATACGTEDGTAPANSGSHPQTPTSAELAAQARASQEAYLQQLRAKHASAAKSPGYGDDRRQSITESADRRKPASHHSPGFSKALPSEW